MKHVNNHNINNNGLSLEDPLLEINYESFLNLKSVLMQPFFLYLLEYNNEKMQILHTPTVPNDLFYNVTF